MSDLNYTITKYDDLTKVMVVSFDDGTWIQINLTNPLPATKTDLEDLIKKRAAPLEAVQARMSPSTDTSFINALIGVPASTTRFSIEAAKIAAQEAAQKSAQTQLANNTPSTVNTTPPPGTSLDPSVLASLQAWNDQQFANKVMSIVNENLATSNTSQAS